MHISYSRKSPRDAAGKVGNVNMELFPFHSLYNESWSIVTTLHVLLVFKTIYALSLSSFSYSFKVYIYLVRFKGRILSFQNVIRTKITFTSLMFTFFSFIFNYQQHSLFLFSPIKKAVTLHKVYFLRLNISSKKLISSTFYSFNYLCQFFPQIFSRIYWILNGSLEIPFVSCISKYPTVYFPNLNIKLIHHTPIHECVFILNPKLKLSIF